MLKKKADFDIFSK